MNAAISVVLLTSYFFLSSQVQGQPSFTQDAYATSVNENVQIGTVLDLTIQATSTGAQAPTYSITAFEGITAFGINQITGEITVEEHIDRETQQVYQFIVVATDELNRAANANVTITVLDVNDNPPIFSESEYSVTVSEDLLLGSVILILQTMDADTGTNAQISLSITGGNEEGKFRIDSTMASLTVAGMLDREITASYTLTVQATDGGVPPLSSSAILTITIVDENDDAPVFEQSSYTTTLLFYALEEWSFTVLASGANATITYSIISGNEEGVFSINAGSGEIQVAAETFDAVRFPNFTLTIQAAVVGFPMRNTAQATVIIIVDISTTTVTAAPETSTTSSKGFAQATLLNGVKPLLLYTLLPSLALLLSASLCV